MFKCFLPIMGVSDYNFGYPIVRAMKDSSRNSFILPETFKIIKLLSIISLDYTIPLPNCSPTSLTMNLHNLQDFTSNVPLLW